MHLSNRARNILGFMIFETLITTYFLWHVSKLPADTALLSEPMYELVLAVILLSIVGGIIVTAIVNGTKNKEAADERDKDIEAKADGYAYRTLVWSIGFFLAFLYASQGLDISHTYQIREILGWFSFTPLHVLAAMVFLLWLSETVKYTTQLRLYKRGF
ncbi:hypothetical protein MNBD_ALPHA06-1063 [hydrothermal vent metagenome]|uniref:Uncharacterized protein n=1 Tax=hydrothermal vent metagenome TaxID=652676 RepID=A0A3B0S9J8_9ZZZZ